jgi:predicted subunit of tRNA(5-methylaminomethyl-2-thiouridylate) methyltransferase
MGEPAVRAALDRKVAAAVEQRILEAADRKAKSAEARRDTMRKPIGDFLQITPQQAEWLIEYVCTVRGLRADGLQDLASGAIDFQTAADRQKSERSDALAEVEQLLGPDRYAKLREVGGLGMLGDLLCAGE